MQIEPAELDFVPGGLRILGKQNHTRKTADATTPWLININGMVPQIISTRTQPKGRRVEQMCWEHSKAGGFGEGGRRGQVGSY